MLTFLFLNIFLLGRNSQKVMPGTPIPPEFWDVSAEIDQNPSDAVVLEDSTQFFQEHILRFRRVRILNENGKSAAEFIDPTGSFRKLRGRVIDRSGLETRIELAEDLVEVLAYKKRGDRVKAKILVPPGMTSDCIVEMSWKEPAEDALPPGVYSKRYYIQEAWPIRKKIIHLTPSAMKTSSNYLMNRFVWNAIFKEDHFKVEKKTYEVLLTYRDIPPLYYHPYGNHHLDRNAAFALLFKSLNYGDDQEEFYKNFAIKYLKPRFIKPFKRTAEYKQWIRELKSRLPEDHLKAMTIIYNDFRERIAITDLLPPDKRAQITKELSENRESYRRMSQVFKLGYGEPADLGYLFYCVLLDCDIPFKLIFAASIYSAPFQPDSFNPFRLYINYPFFGIELAKGKWVVFTPQWQENAPGFLPTAFQGTNALVVDPLNKFKHSFTRLPRYGSKAHMQVREYQTHIAGDGTVDMSVDMFGSGVYDAREKNRYFSLSPDEKEETLRRTWKHSLASWEILKAVVTIPSLKSRSNCRIVARTKQDLDDGTWLAFDPFPCDSVPLSSPSVWPPNRQQPIMLPHCSTQIQINRITVPEGWRLKGNPSWVKQNGFGTVKLSAAQEGNLITVRRDIEIIKDIFIPPEVENDLKFFIAWLDEVSSQSIGIDMGAAQ